MASSSRSTTVSIEGDRAYVDAFSAVARARGTTMAKLVRQAIDASYGKEINRALLFFASDGNSNVRDEVSITTKESR